MQKNKNLSTRDVQTGDVNQSNNDNQSMHTINTRKTFHIWHLEEKKKVS